MKTNKQVWLFSLIAIFAILAIINLNAQEEEHGILKVQKEGEGINKGIVVAFGKKIPKPYFVTLDDGKILINGIVFSPREKDPTIEEKEFVVTEMDVKRHELIKSCEKDYVKYYFSEGEQKAREKILEEYSDHELISELIFKDDILTIEFADSSKENIMLNSFIMPKPTKEQIKEQVKKETDMIKSFLSQGGMIAFGYEYTMHIPNRNAKKIGNIISEIQKEKISLKIGKEYIMELVRDKEKIVNEIIKNINTWD